MTAISSTPYDLPVLKLGKRSGLFSANDNLTALGIEWSDWIERASALRSDSSRFDKIDSIETVGKNYPAASK